MQPTWNGVLARLPDALLVYRRRDLVVVEVSHEEGLFGFGREALVGRPLSELVPDASSELFEALLAGSHDPHPDTPLRLSARERGGDEVPVDIKASAVDDEHAVAVLRRISQSARIAERELVTVICSAPEAIITWSRDGRIVSWNPGAERLYGVRAVDAIGSAIERLLPEAERPAFAAAQRQLLDGEKPTVREARRLRGGDEIEVEESLFLVRDSGPRPLRIGSFSRDLGEVARLRQVTRILSRTETPPAVLSSDSPAMREALNLIDAAAREPSVTVLLLGETGVGKSYLARRIHALSPRANRPFLEVNCASLEPQLAESELFGHERGAFTGASAAKRGLVEAADGGTLLLDEIGELPAGVQAKLLTFLDERRFRRVGGTTMLGADVRLIAATNADLAAAVEAKAFRRDLLYRLSVMPIEIPPLRRRREDVAAMAQHLLRELRGRAAPAIAPDAVAAICRYDWPGNLRELRNALERAAIVSRGQTLERAHLPAEVRGGPAPGASPAAPDGAAAEQTLLEVQRRHIEAVLAEVDGNRTLAAQRLGINRSTLRRKLAELRIKG